jgi:hypothetical protein
MKKLLAAISVLALLVPQASSAAISVGPSSLKAFAAGANQAATVTLSTTGTNQLLLIGTWDNVGSNSVTSVTYGAQSMTKLNQQNGGTGAGIYGVNLWYLLSPVIQSGTATVSTNSTGSTAFVALSYDGVKQTGFPDGQATQFRSTSAANGSIDTTTTASNAWIASFLSEAANAPTAGAGTVMRQNSASGFGGFDTGAAIASPAKTTLNFTFNTGGGFAAVSASFAPATTAAAATASLAPVPINGGVSDSGGGMSI